MANPFDTLGDLVIRIIGDYSQLQKDLDDAAKAAKESGDKIAGSMEAASEGAGTLGVSFTAMAAAAATAAAGVAFLTSEIVGLVKEFGAAAEETQNMADKLNLSVQETRHLSEMAQVAGVNMSVLQRASARLALALDDSGGAGKKVATALDQMGIAGSDSGEVLKKLLEHLASLPDATQRLAEATKIMGRGAVELEPLLKNYQSLSDAIDQLGGSIDSELIGKLTEADDAFDKLGIAWSHLKEGLAGTFAPAVTAGLEVLTKLISGTPKNTLEQQLMDVNEQLIQMQVNSNKATVAVAGMMGGGFVSGGVTASEAGRLALENRAAEIQGLIEATKRSREYNDEIDKSNRAVQLWAQGAAARAKEAAKDADQAFRDANEEFRATAQEVKDQQDAWERLTRDLRFFHVELSDPAVEDAKARLENLTKAQHDGYISLRDLQQAQADYNKVFGFDFATYLEHAITLTEQMDQKFQKLNESISAQRDLLRSPEFSGTTAAVLANLNANVPSTPDQAVRAKGTPLGDSLLGLGISRDDETLKKVKLLNDLLDSQDATLKEVDLGWAQMSGELRKLSTVDLPQAIGLFEKYIQVQVDEGAAIGRISALRQQELSLIIEERTQRGESVTEYMIQLEQMRLAEEARRDRLQAMGKLYIELMGDFKKSFDIVGKAIADNIVDGKNWADVWHSLVKSIEKMFLETLIGSAFKALGTEIIRVTGLAGGLAKVFGGIFGGAASSAAGGAVSAASGAAGSAASAAGSVGSAAGSFGGLLGTLGNLGSFAGGIAAIGSGITSGIQGARTNNLLGEIEISTRQTKEQLVGGTQTVLLTWLPKLDYLYAIWNTLKSEIKPAIVQNTEMLATLITNPGGLSGAILGTMGAPGARTPQELAQSQQEQASTSQDVADANKQVVNSGKSLSRGFVDLNTALTTASTGLTGSYIPGLGGTKEPTFQPGYELDTGGGIGFQDWLTRQNFQNVQPLIDQLTAAGVTAVQLFQYLAGFAKGSDFAGAFIGNEGSNESGLRFRTSTDFGKTTTTLAGAYEGGFSPGTDYTTVAHPGIASAPSLSSPHDSSGFAGIFSAMQQTQAASTTAANARTPGGILQAMQAELDGLDRQGLDPGVLAQARAAVSAKYGAMLQQLTRGYIGTNTELGAAAMGSFRSGFTNLAASPIDYAASLKASVAGANLQYANPIAPWAQGYGASQGYVTVYNVDMGSQSMANAVTESLVKNGFKTK